MAKYLDTDYLYSLLPIHGITDPITNYKAGPEVVDYSKPSLWAFVAMTAFNPIFWNVVARNEYRNKTITRIVGSPYVGCYILAATIFSLSAFRDSLFLKAVKDQPAHEILADGLIQGLSFSFFATGQVFVLSSMIALGVTGTYLGDYFGILMTSRVTGFPFNVFKDPMYTGSFFTHLGTALYFQSPAGILLSLWVLLVYRIALRFEGPFTDKIYSGAHKKNDDATATSTRSVPTTPRKSSRLAAKDQADGEPHSYAEAAAEEPAKDNVVVPAQTPRRSARGRVSAVQRGEGSGSDSPMRMTRSKSKSRGLGSDEE